jgi:ABC-type lipoprotein release transport system permease subunit
MALGAAPRDVVRMVVGQGVRLGALGVAVGLALALVATRALAPLLFGTSVLDPVALGAVPLLLGAVAVGASWAPARRAARVDAAVALRAE